MATHNNWKLEKQRVREEREHWQREKEKATKVRRALWNCRAGQISWDEVLNLMDALWPRRRAIRRAQP